MKKILSVLMAVVMVFSVVMLFASCSKDEPNTDPSNVEVSNEDVSASAEMKTVKDGVLTMATNAAFPPYEYKEGEEFKGIDVEIAGKIAEKLGLTLEIVDTEFDSIIGGVKAGKYDMGMAGMTIDETRKKSVDFSDPYAKGIQVVIVSEDSAIADVADIKDDGSMKIGVQQGTTGDIYTTGDYGEDNVVRYPNGAGAVEALKTGKVDCVVIDNEPAKVFVEKNEGLKILDTEYIQEDYAICFSKDNKALSEKVNATLNELMADGTVDEIIAKYIKAE